ncbi:phage minor head protein [Acidaminococcus provencensis]|uniref:phage head morphogenesis protein n=1 Tax=Acidaminococcus provencensis TaxID=2058289 RepID=UPI000CF98298|nr:phage minor head protein [Acidaminococcus provencensis]
MNKEKFKPRRVVEKRYQAAIKGIVRRMRRKLETASTPTQAITMLREMARSPTMDAAARMAAMAMATQVMQNGYRTWREAAAAGSKGTEIYYALTKELNKSNAFREIIDRNAELIKSVPADATQALARAMAEGYEAGVRPEDLKADIMNRFSDLTEAKARLIARTETSKAATALTRVRAQRIGAEWYVWRTSEDARVRSSHAHMDGVLVNWSDPPSPEKLIGMKDYGSYHAGEFPNCRCYAEPLLDYDDVKWPHKVYRGGRITSMTLAGFKKITGGGAI